MVKPIRKNTSKNPPILSHEFVIQNHADIVSCVAMVFVIGIMVQVSYFAICYEIACLFNMLFIDRIGINENINSIPQATSPIASIFITLQHNVTEPGEIPLYMPGPQDWCAVFFYSLICIVTHAILQEYVLDVSRIIFFIYYTNFHS